MIALCSTTFRPDLSSSLYIFSIWLYQLHDKRDTYKFKDESTSEIPRDGFFFPLCMVSKKPFRNYCFQRNKMSRSINDSFVGGSQRMVTKFNLIDKLHTDLANCCNSVLPHMLTWRFAVHLNCSLVELVGLVIEKTEVAYLKSFPCIVVKKEFHVTCGVAIFQVQKMKLILFCCLPASLRR